LVIQSSEHITSVENVTLSQFCVLTVQDSTNDNLSDVVILIQLQILFVYGAKHDLSSDTGHVYRDLLFELITGYSLINGNLDVDGFIEQELSVQGQIVDSLLVEGSINDFIDNKSTIVELLKANSLIK
jgi:hypothetical protein